MTQERLARVKENDARLREITELNRSLETQTATLETAWAVLAPLLDYYQSDWLDDFTALDGTPDGQYGVLSEDGVWNEIARFYTAICDLQEAVTLIKAAYEQTGS